MWLEMAIELVDSDHPWLNPEKAQVDPVRDLEAPAKAQARPTHRATGPAHKKKKKKPQVAASLAAKREKKNQIIIKKKNEKLSRLGSVRLEMKARAEP